MPDIELRFNKDMLVLSAPIDAALARQGIDAARDRQYLNLMEPDTVSDALKLEVSVGAQCVVTTTEDITQARLAHLNMAGDAGRLVESALAVANEVKPQHVLAEIGPSGLPLDAASKASLNENRSQYACAAKLFEGGDFDAYFLNGFRSLSDLKCALMGVAQVSGKPVFASIVIGQGADCRPIDVFGPDRHHGIDDILGTLPFDGYEAPDDHSFTVDLSANPGIDPADWVPACQMMQEYGASVVGFETSHALDKAVAYVQQAVEAVDLPVLAQLRVTARPDDSRTAALVPPEARAGYALDSLDHAAVKLYGAGAQFLRATGLATSAHTGALAATVFGLDVRR